jgi:anti-sigma factor ChrR (cupin superfamily)
MTRKPFEHSEETQAWAALYSLGSLSGEEKAIYEQHLQEGCADCAQEIQSFQGVVEDLSLSATAVVPSGKARERLFASLGVQEKAAAPKESQSSTRPKGILLREPGLLIARSSEMPWEEAAPGIDRRVLSVDSERDYITTLVRVQPGTRYPSHRHAGVEELLVLEGDLHVHGIVMRAGDYCRAEPHSIHDVTYSESGCLLLLRTSQRDEIRV